MTSSGTRRVSLILAIALGVGAQGVEREQGSALTLADLWGAQVGDDLGDVPALDPVAAEVLAANALALRHLFQDEQAGLGENEGEPGADEAAPAKLRAIPAGVPPLPPLTIEEHRARLQPVAAWSVADPSADPPQRGTVVDVVNAKTLLVDLGGRISRVALYGVQVPLEEQPYGPEAYEFLGTHLASVGNEVVVVPVSKRGRNTYAVVLTKGADGLYEPLGELLLRHGLGWWNERYAGLDQRLRALHFAAVDAGIGCVAGPGVLSPGAFGQIQARTAQGGYEFQGEVIRGRVVEAIDGDTLRVKVEPGHLEAVPHLREYVYEENGQILFTVRLAGVDAPEIDQPGGVQAWAISHLTCGEAEVELVLLDAAYGDVNARLICADGECLGEKLVRTGRARHFEFFLPDQRLAKLENLARREQVGIWSTDLAVIPGMWRDIHVRVQGLWAFEGDVHYVTFDPDQDPGTTEDQLRLTMGQYKDRSRPQFDSLCAGWSPRFRSASVRDQ